MVIYFGADHRGFDLKGKLAKNLQDQGYEVVDLGDKERNEDDDYVDFAAAVGAKVSADPDNGRGVVICGSGAGAAITANKFRRVRAAIGISNDQVYDARQHDDLNVLALAADFVSEEAAREMVRVFLTAPWNGGERYRRRLEKIGELETGN